MAAFADGNFETPTVADKTTVELDGVINDGEYGYSRTIAKSDIGKGSLSSDLTEYFAYDDDYLYYAFKTTATGLSENKMNIHFGSSLYDRDQLNRGDHTLMGEYKFSNGKFTLNSSNIASKPIAEEGDMDCQAKYDKPSKTVTYELKIRRGYLRDNGSPDNLLSYTLLFGGAEHYYKLSSDHKTELEELGINKKFIWTYNYVYFGTRPEATEVPPLTTTTVATEAPDDPIPEPATSGCKSSLAIAAVAMIPVIAGAALFAKREKMTNYI
jgi:hypothetical protein